MSESLEEIYKRAFQIRDLLNNLPLETAEEILKEVLIQIKSNSWVTIERENQKSGKEAFKLSPYSGTYAFKLSQ